MLQDHSPSATPSPNGISLSSETQPQAGDTSLPGYIPLSKLNRYVEPGSRGKRRHPSCFYRYAKRGVRGIRLRTWQFPDGVYTTLSAWYAFIEELSSVKRPRPGMSPSASPRASAKRQSSVEAEIEALRGSLGRKAATAGR
ncbi:MAG: DUF1580 domain-containing protein [Gemmataceae bacterium]